MLEIVPSKMLSASEVEKLKKEQEQEEAWRNEIGPLTRFADSVKPFYENGFLMALFLEFDANIKVKCPHCNTVARVRTWYVAYESNRTCTNCGQQNPNLW